MPKGVYLGNKGKIPWNKGKKSSDEHRRKLSEAKKRNPVRYWRGKKRPELSGKNNPNYGKFGKEHPCWKDEKQHLFTKTIRELFLYRQWRSDIFTRDDFTCVLCGVRGSYLEADHYPKRFADILKEYEIKTIEEALNCAELWNLNNGRTLCKECHYRHTFGK